MQKLQQEFGDVTLKVHPPFRAAASIQEEVRRSSKTIQSSVKVDSSPLRLFQKLQQEFGDVTLKVHPPLTGSSLKARGGQEVLKNQLFWKFT